jgi:pimeloyl-ACP methyl ester carboxylesterase
MRAILKTAVVVLLAAAVVVLGVRAARLQSGPPSPRTVTVEGLAMRVWGAGLDQRKAGQPVVVLEAGGGADLETWKPVFGEIARLAPTVAYDRLGHGGSAPDTNPPTLERAGRVLHALLQELRASPPYVLVGHSWGGVIVRGFSDMYASETAGLVYLDVPDFETTRQERAAVLPPQDRQEALAPPVFPPIPADTPAGLRAAYEQMLEEMKNDYPTARKFRQPSGIPAAVVVTTRADRLRGNGGAIVRLQMARQSEWALTSRDGLFLLAGHAGHQVHRDDPALVVQLVKHVLDRASAQPR